MTRLCSTPVWRTALFSLNENKAVRNASAKRLVEEKKIRQRVEYQMAVQALQRHDREQEEAALQSATAELLQLVS